MNEISESEIIDILCSNEFCDLVSAFQLNCDRSLVNQKFRAFLAVVNAQAQTKYIEDCHAWVRDPEGAEKDLAEADAKLAQAVIKESLITADQVEVVARMLHLKGAVFNWENASEVVRDGLRKRARDILEAARAKA